jgi:hypothetical protein
MCWDVTEDILKNSSGSSLTTRSYHDAEETFAIVIIAALFVPDLIE